MSRRGPIAVFVARFSAFLRAVVPGLAGMSDMHYPTFLAANALGGVCWGILYVLLGYFVGQKVEQASGIASYVLLGVIAVVIVVLFVRHRRRSKEEIEGPAEEPADHGDGARMTVRAQAGGSMTERSPARRPASTRANSPAASSPCASVSIQRTAAGSARSIP